MSLEVVRKNLQFKVQVMGFSYNVLTKAEAKRTESLHSTVLKVHHRNGQYKLCAERRERTLVRGEREFARPGFGTHGWQQ